MKANADKSLALRKKLFVAGIFVVAVALALALVWLRPETKSFTPSPAFVELSRDQLLFTNRHLVRRGETNPFTGLMIDRYASGALRSCSTISNGLLNGVSHGWHTNGQLQVEEFFVDGVSHGTRTRWFTDGAKESEAPIAHGVIEGVFRKWHTNGVLAQQITLSNGVPQGLSRAWRPDGTLNEVNLRDGMVTAKATGM